MLAFARSPESYAAWQQVKRNVARRVGVRRPHDDDDDARRNRGTQELHRLLSRTPVFRFSKRLFHFLHPGHSFSARTRTPHLGNAGQKNRTQRVSHARASRAILPRIGGGHPPRRTVLLAHLGACIADLQEGIENYRHMFDEHLKLVDFVHQ